MYNLKKKNILISGVGKGLGKEIMGQCINCGAKVFGFTRSKKDFSEIKKKYKDRVNIFLGDINDQKFLNGLFNYLNKKKIFLNGLINNAGIRQRKDFIKITQSDLKEVMNTNFMSLFFLTQKFLKQSKKKDFGSVVNIGSIVGDRGFADLTGYASSKSALFGFTKSLAVELANKNYNIRVNCINPGFTKTSYFENFKKKKYLYKWTLKNIPAKRWANSKEISNLVIFLLSNKSSYINGETINIDGGWTS